MHEILPGIYAWRWPSPRFGYDFNGHLLEGLCIDPVEMDEATLEEIATRGVDKILLTNRNHFRAAERVRLRTGAKVAAHPADTTFVRSKGVVVEEALADGQMVGPLRVVAVPGKSPGEVAFHWPERRILVVGDACVGNPPGQLGLLPAAAIDDAVRLRESLRALLAVDFDTMLVGDGAAIFGGARERLRELVERP